MTLANKETRLVFMFDPPWRYAPGLSVFWDFCHPLIDQYLPSEFFDPTKKYNDNTVFYYDAWNAHYGTDYLTQHLAQGYRVVFDNKNERLATRHLYPNALDICNQYHKQCLWLVSGDQLSNSAISHSVIPLWFWCYDYLNFQKYQGYQSTPTNEYKFLMLMRRVNMFRDYIYHELSDILSMSLYSYWHRGMPIPGDASEDTGEAQRMIDPAWYNRTSLSLVVESDISNEENIFITEKTFKPIIMLHPWIIYGQPGSIKFMQQHGFETFPELWDESYDSIIEFDKKAKVICGILKDFDTRAVYQPIIQEKLQYNRNKFFNRTQAEAMYTDHLVKPLYNFVYE